MKSVIEPITTPPARHSDTVLVTDNGCVSLTDYPDSLDELTLMLP